MGQTLDGSLNVGSFRGLIEAGRIPPKESFTHQGLINSYYFPIENDLKEKNCKELLEPRFAVASSVNPFTKEKEDFISVELHTSKDGINKRAPMNCIIVLDISGSMQSPFDQEVISEGNNTKRKTKMEIANECVAELVKDLKDDENIAIILFDDRVKILQSFTNVKNLNKENLIQKILSVQTRGGTNMELGFRTANEILTDEFKDNEKLKEKNTRIVFLTDAQPNCGRKEDLPELIKEASEIQRYTTLVGIGLDFSSSVADSLTKNSGCNYFSVKNKEEFHKLLVDDFNYIVSPLCKDTFITIESPGYEIDKVYGTTYTNSKENSSLRLKIGGFGASPKGKEGLKGGQILIKLKEMKNCEQGKDDIINCSLTYTTLKEQKEEEFVKNFNFKEEISKLSKEKKEYENNTIRKLILLVRYVNEIHKFIDTSKRRIDNFQKDRITFFKNAGNLDENGFNKEFSKDVNEEMEKKIKEFEKVSPEMKEHLKSLKSHLKKEIIVLGDDLSKEIEVIDQLMYAK